MTKMQISDIKIGDRARKDMGDLHVLAASIKELGLLHPPAVTPDGRLIAGQRRIEACALLGITDIEVHIIDVDNLLCAERDENEVRKAFTPSESVAIGRAIEKQLKADESSRRSAARKKVISARKNGQLQEHDDSSRSCAPPYMQAASAVGMCGQRYLQAKQVVAAAEQYAEKFGDIVETMDQTGNVKGAYTELRRRRDNEPARHAVHRKMRFRDPDAEVERAIVSLSGLCMGICRIDTVGLDKARVETWSKELKRQISILRTFLRRLNNEHND